jgi:hypothetical protein
VKKAISATAAANVLLVALGALAVFHVLMLAGALPDDMVWGGRASGGGAAAPLEVVGLAVTVLFATVAAVKIGYITAPRLAGLAAVGMWVMFGYFVLNVLGNLASTSAVERGIFVPYSIVLALLTLRLALERRAN